MDKYEFDRKVAMLHIALVILLTIGGALFAAGIAFLTTGAVEVNHGMDLKGESQNRILTTAFGFIGLGAEIFAIGLFIIAVSGIAISAYVYKLSVSLKPDVNKSDNTQNSDHSDSLKINQQEEEIKNVNTRLEIENLKLELVNLKIEVAAQKLEQIKNKTNTKSSKARRAGTKSKRK